MHVRENTDEKRAAVSKLARSKASLRVVRKPTNTRLYGTSVRGGEICQEIQRRANDEARRIKDLLLGKSLIDVSPSGVDLTRPTFTDWQRLLEQIAPRLFDRSRLLVCGQIRGGNRSRLTQISDDCDDPGYGNAEKR